MALRAEFPEADGHLFEVLLQKGKAGLGLSIVASTTQSLRGIVIMGIQPGGVAELCGRLKWGDMILKVNDTCVLGMSQQKVQELLAKAPPTVRFVLLRQHKVEETQEQQKGKVSLSDNCYYLSVQYSCAYHMVQCGHFWFKSSKQRLCYIYYRFAVVIFEWPYI